MNTSLQFVVLLLLAMLAVWGASREKPESWVPRLVLFILALGFITGAFVLVQIEPGPVLFFDIVLLVLFGRHSRAYKGVPREGTGHRVMSWAMFILAALLVLPTLSLLGISPANPVFITIRDGFLTGWEALGNLVRQALGTFVD